MNTLLRAVLCAGLALLTSIAGAAPPQTINDQGYLASATNGTPVNSGEAPVLVNGPGQSGAAVSSRRFKDDIIDMDSASNALMNLRPVTFHYKADRNPSGRTLQYGLIAEEVARIFPGLVTHAADGQIETVMYQFLPPMLLNEFQKQQRTIQNQAARIDLLEKHVDEIAVLKRQVAQLLAQSAVSTKAK